MFRRVGHFAPIVLSQTLMQVGSEPDVMMIGILFGYQTINVVESGLPGHRGERSSVWVWPGVRLRLVIPRPKTSAGQAGRIRSRCRGRLRSSLPLVTKPGAESRIRTDDLLITNELLYQLSYSGNDKIF